MVCSCNGCATYFVDWALSLRKDRTFWEPALSSFQTASSLSIAMSKLQTETGQDSTL